MSLVVKKETVRTPHSYLFGLIKVTRKATNTQRIFEGKVVRITQRWFHAMGSHKDGCFIILEKDGKFQKLTTTRIPKKDADTLLIGKKVKITEQNFEEIKLEDIEIVN